MTDDAQEWMGRTPDELRRAAYHEAGHAVVQRVVGMLCGSATIVPDHEEMTAGFAIIHDPWAVYSAWERRGKFRNHHYEFDPVRPHHGRHGRPRGGDHRLRSTRRHER